ncbi:hypothetical protein PHMEG_00020851 [Phytophthora megakarya]|uniref:Uncharacterized protein n=1 Tax=Phytophthora megakarya TaxID=4795 RepID=A0A225VMV3_9STRA|nr:hypothetical protein PHMEG_00020851 [Phytophthora megakarya]
MTSTNKAFAYVFNTTSEDQKVARVLSGWDAKQARDIANLLFQTSICAEDPGKRLSDRVCEVLTASLIQHFPEVLERYLMCPYVSRMRVIHFDLGIEKAQLLAWSSELRRKAMNKNIDPEGNGGDKLSREDTLINHQNSKLRRYRVGSNESSSYSRGTFDPLHPNTVVPAKPKGCGSKSHLKWPAAIWFEWYAKPPRLYDACENRHKKSTYKQIVDDMKLFLQMASRWTHRHLRIATMSLNNRKRISHGAKRKSGSSVLKQLRKYYNEGKLDALITEFRARVAIETILDSAPRETQDLFVPSLSNYSVTINPIQTHTHNILKRKHFGIRHQTFESSMLSIADIVTYRDFKTLYITYVFFFLDASVRDLRNSIIHPIRTRDRVPEALCAIFVSLKDTCKAKSKKKKSGLIELDDIQEWLILPTNGAVGQVRGAYRVRRLLQRAVMGNKPHYVVDWEPTLEPRENITKELVTQFNRYSHI